MRDWIAGIVLAMNINRIFLLFYILIELLNFTAFAHDRWVKINITPELPHGIGINVVALASDRTESEVESERMTNTTWSVRLADKRRHKLLVLIPRISWKKEVLYERLLGDEITDVVFVRFEYAECAVPVKEDMLNEIQRTPEKFLVYVKGAEKGNFYYSYCGKLRTEDGRALFRFPIAKSGKFKVELLNLSFKENSPKRIASSINVSISKLRNNELKNNKPPSK